MPPGVTFAPLPAPPAAVVKKFRLSPFYQKYVDVGGVPVVGSMRPMDAAIREAAFVVRSMLQFRPDVLKTLASRKVRVAVMAVSELTLDIPEHSDLPSTFNRRARGLGATAFRPASSCAEENLLGCPGDPYKGESILIHEFGHTVHLMGLPSAFDLRVRAAFGKAVTEQKKWKGTYAGTNHEEYWAEGVQSYFDANRPKPDADHNFVNTREELKDYDPGLFDLIDEAFLHNPWRYSVPRDRPDDPHLAGVDFDDLPPFSFPPQ